MRDVYSRGVQKIIKYIKAGITQEKSSAWRRATTATSGRLVIFYGDASHGKVCF